MLHFLNRFLVFFRVGVWKEGRKEGGRSKGRPRKMVNSKIIRAGGLLVLAGCYVLVERAFNKNVVGDAKQTHVALVGSGR